MAQDDYIPLGGDEEIGPSTSKPQKERKDRVNTTLFISSLPYTATSTDLLTHFSFLGPVRHGFIATDKETGKSKGVGYVTYSLKEDAEQAVKEFDGGEFGGAGRKIRVAWADKRPEYGDRYDAEKKPKVVKAKARPEAVDTSNNDPNAIRTLVLSGLPKDLTKAVLWKKVRKADETVDLLFPVEGEVDTAHLVCSTHGAALQALPKLHGHTYKGSILSCVLKKRLEKLSQVEKGKGASHAGRLIVRNLAWDVTEQDLRATFLPYGPIQSINLPTQPSKFADAPPRARGFAFVWFIARRDAEKAMEGVNGKMIKKAGGNVKGKDKVKGEEGRVVAVDWALSKDKWEETQKGDEGEGKGEKVETDSGSSSDSDSESGSGSRSSSETSEDEDEDEEMDVDEEEPVKPTLPTVDVGSTLFIRNLPFEVEEHELNTLFRTFGPLRYARITIDRETGRSRGSGFVCFWKVEDADRAIEEAQKVAQETGANAMPLGGKNPFALPSVLTADPSSSLASKLVLHGRALDVTRAVTREEAGRIKEDGERARTVGDKRNTYLMREGVIFPNSPAAQSLPEAEIDKRQTAFNARKTLLKSNPSLYISKTRLSIRQLPLFVTDRTLKRFAIHAVRTFDAEVKAGRREGLSREEEMDGTISPALVGKGKKKGERETVVVQSKVVRSGEKVDPLIGGGRSKGYGFLEMRSHKDALKVLRWGNNNEEVGASLAEWWRGEMGEIRDRAKGVLEKGRQAAKEGVEEGKGKVEESKKGKSGSGGGSGPGKEVESLDELEARVRRLDSRLAEDPSREGGMRGGKTLMIEFSIENIQVVKRRVEKITAVRSGNDTPRARPETNRDRKRKAEIPAEDSDDEGKGRGEKKTRGGAGGRGGKRGVGDRPGRGDKRGGDKRDGDKPTVSQPTVPAEKKGLEKLGSHLGSLIGRKRKARKG